MISSLDNFITSVTTSLPIEFAVKDLGHFLRIHCHNDGSLFLTQHHYARNLLERVNLANVKPINTLMDPNLDLYINEQPYEDPTQFWQVVGVLQYLTTTRLDLMFMINKLSQFMQSPMMVHWQALIQILHFVSSTIFGESKLKSASIFTRSIL